jgi:hypothetical protein
MSKTNSIAELREDLLRVYDGLRDGSIEPKEAKEINNTAGKIIASAKAQLEYSAVRGEKPEIEFLK